MSRQLMGAQGASLRYGEICKPMTDDHASSREWWNTLTPAQRRSVVARIEPDALATFSAHISQRWESLPVSALLLAQRCFERVARAPDHGSR